MSETDAKPSLVELPGWFGKPDPKIADLLAQVAALNEEGKIDSMAIVTTSYAHGAQFRHRLGQTRTSLLGGMAVLLVKLADEAARYEATDIPV